ncbi:unnamed protein product [Nippostrongylus brasiliensis]|uniref:Transposase n=1 Tax=Nippostrongylus brasiliensis TaxID=27835 RepID=A0A0N4YJR4_NIPBR|nr:unnamed protein product [Nippostrongylus brasiliensis]
MFPEKLLFKNMKASTQRLFVPHFIISPNGQRTTKSRYSHSAVHDGALPHRKPKLCVRKHNKKFCDLVRQAHQANVNILRELREVPLHGTPKEEKCKKRLFVADQKVLKVLNKTKKEELLAARKETLTAEGDLLFKAKRFCGRTLGEEFRCADVAHRFADAIDELVRAVIVVLPFDVSPTNKAVKKAHKDSKDQHWSNPKSDYAELALTLSKAVVAAIPAQKRN